MNFIVKIIDLLLKIIQMPNFRMTQSIILFIIKPLKRSRINLWSIDYMFLFGIIEIFQILKIYLR